MGCKFIHWQSMIYFVVILFASMNIFRCSSLKVFRSPMKSHFMNRNKSFHCQRIFQSTNNNIVDEFLDPTAWKSFKYGPIVKEKISKNHISIDKEHEEEKVIAGSNALDPMWSQLSNEEIKKSITVLSEFVSLDRIEKFNTILNMRSDRIRFVFENPSNPNNIWAALRTFDSFGIQFVDIILSGDSDCEFTRQGRMNAALGSQKWLTLQQHSNTTECFRRLHEEGYTILASDLHSESIPLSTIPWESFSTCRNTKEVKIAMVMGNEVRGISNEARQAADRLVHIPMKGFAESFNLSVAAAILCASFDNAGLFSPNLSEDAKQRILFTWCLKSVKGSLSILRRHEINVLGNQVYPKIGKVSTKP